MERFKKCLIPLLPIFTAFNLHAQSHFISSFSPASGPVGTTVVINGAGFSAVADSNKVLFGHIKAAIINASPTSLTVTVPAKATYNSITVITSKWTIMGGQPAIKNFTAVSDLPFDVTFEDDGIIAPNAFNIETVIYDTALGSTTYTGDFDGDEKLDFSAGKTKLRNISQDTPAFSRPVNLPGYVPTTPYATYINGGIMGCGDVNEDGLPDLYANANNIGSDFSIAYLSIPGNFDSVKTGGGGGFIVNNGISFPDLNNDGYSDAVYIGQSVLNSNGYGLYGTVGYPNDCFYRIAYDYYTFFCADLNGDGFKDVVGGFDYSTQGVEPGIEFIQNRFPNSSTFTNLFNISDIVFASPPTYQKVTSINGADFNGDGKIDLVITISGQGVKLLLNSSTPDTISFLPSILLANIGNVHSINDINGDGKPDIIGNGFIYKNISTGNNISFSPGVASPKGIIGDFDADGKNDFLVLNGNKRSVFRHNPVSSRKFCADSYVSFITSVNGSAFQWQLNTGGGFSDIADNAVYSGTNTAALQVSSIPSSSYGYEYRCLVDNNPSGTFKVTFENNWLGTSSNVWEDAANWSCGTLPDANTDVVISNGTAVLHTNTSIRSLTVSPSANFTVAPGIILTITH